MKDRLDWDTDGRDWPNRSASMFVSAGGLDWHVQKMGQGPVVLLLHGTGSSTHSWAGMAPLLAPQFTVIAADLPGHAFTGLPDSAGLSLPGMSRLTGLLLRNMNVQPAVAVGHSAGAAILMNMCQEGLIAPRLLVSINGAFLPYGGAAASIFSPLAKMLVMNPIVPRVVAWRAQSQEAVKRLLQGTGSEISEESLNCYMRLFQCVQHVKGTLGMMAGWDLVPLLKNAGKFKASLLLLAATGDKTVPPSDAQQVQRAVAQAFVVGLERLGHLAHEERPDLVAQLICEHAERAGLVLGRH